jgi:glycogen operon protein
MVQTFHDQGMEVGMELCFPDSASPKFMEEAACFWVKYYGIDGFRIYCSREGKKHLASVPYLGRTKLIFENWEQPDRTDLKSPVWKQIGISNSAFLCQLRSFLKGDCHKTEAAFHAMTANGWNTSMVNYMAGHDGFTLFDSVSYDYKHNEANGEGNKDGSFENFSWNCGAEGFTRKRSIQNLRLKMLQNAFVLLLLSQGTPYIHNGDEFANSQEGNNNAWCQDNEMGWLNWKHPKCYDGLQPFVKRLIAFRREHKVFHQKMPLRMIDTRSCGYPDLSCHGNQPWRMDFENDRHGLGLLYCGDYVEEPGEGVYVVYNMYWEEQEFYLPRPEADKAWHLVLDTQQAGEAAFVWEKAASGQQILVAPRSIRVYETGPAVQTEP